MVWFIDLLVLFILFLHSEKPYPFREALRPTEWVK